MINSIRQARRRLLPYLAILCLSILMTGLLHGVAAAESITPVPSQGDSAAGATATESKGQPSSETKASSDREATSEKKDKQTGYLSEFDESRDPVSSIGPGQTLLRLVISLAIIIGLIYAVVWLLKRFGGARFGGPAQGSLIRSISSTPLGPGHSIHIVSIGGKVLVVGLFEKGMTMLAEIEDADTLARIEEELGQRDESFDDVLSGVYTGGKMPRGRLGPVTPQQWIQDKVDALRRITARTAGGSSSTRSGSPGKSASRAKVVSSQGEDKVGWRP